MNSTKIIITTKAKEIFRCLGINPTLKGSKLIIKIVQIIIIEEKEFLPLEELYRTLSSTYSNLSANRIKNDIKYALENRDNNLAQKNFITCFGFDYDDYYFTNSKFIDELSNILNRENNSFI